MKRYLRWASVGLLFVLFFAPLQAAAAADEAPPPREAPAKGNGGKKSDAGKNTGGGKKSERAARSGTAIESLRKTGEELLNLQEKMRALETQSLRRRQAAADRVADLAAEKEAARRTVEALQSLLALKDKEAGTKRDALAAKEKELAKLRQSLNTCTQALEQHLLRLEKRIEGGAIWRITSRKAAVEDVRRAAAVPGAGLAGTLREAGKLQDSEETLGRLVESGTAELELSDGALSLPAFHLGLLGVAFVSPDGSIAGFAKAGQKLEEGRIAGPEAAEAGQGYRLALDVLRRKRIPQVADLYLPGLPRETEEEK